MGSTETPLGASLEAGGSEWGHYSSSGHYVMEPLVAKLTVTDKTVFLRLHKTYEFLQILI